MSPLVIHCERHPDRRAIGVCVVTRRAICSECSTQYRGVNYSKEGLAQLLAGRRTEQAQSRSPGLLLLLVVLAPLGLWATLGTARYAGRVLIDMAQEARDQKEFGW